MQGGWCRWEGCCRTRGGAGLRRLSVAGLPSTQTKRNPANTCLQLLLTHLRAVSLPALLSSTAALADYHVDILPPASPTAQDAYNLHWGVLWVCVAIFFIVFGAMFWSIYKHR